MGEAVFFAVRVVLALDAVVNLGVLFAVASLEALDLLVRLLIWGGRVPGPAHGAVRRLKLTLPRAIRRRAVSNVAAHGPQHEQSRTQHGVLNRRGAPRGAQLAAS